MSAYLMKDKPDWSKMNSFFPMKFSPFKYWLSAPITASLLAGEFSLMYWCIRLSAPNFCTNYYTSLLFCTANENMEQAAFLASALVLSKIISITVFMPPHRHRFKLLLGWSSTNSKSSSSISKRTSRSRD